jgi:hypothetical protein
MTGIVVDTCVWSIALRGGASKDTQIADALTQLIDENQLKIFTTDKDFDHYSKHLPISFYALS